jgi:hypothetical protein
LGPEADEQDDERKCGHHHENRQDRVLEVQYKGGAQKVVVPDSAVIVSYNPADRTVLKPGAPVFVISQPQPDGSLIAARVNVGLKGQAPPM